MILQHTYDQSKAKSRIYKEKNRRWEKLWITYSQTEKKTKQLKKNKEIASLISINPINKNCHFVPICLVQILKWDNIEGDKGQES